MADFKAKKDQPFTLSVGTGTDAGKARISPAVKGVVPTHFLHGLVFRFGYVPMLGTDAAEKEFVAVKAIGKDGFEIDLPPWFKAS